jgi:hypothetical protein
MEHISSKLPGKAKPADKITERGELMKYFMDTLNTSRRRDGLAPLSMPRMGKVLQAIPTKDLYYLKSVCDQAKDFSKKFWWEINPKNHTGGPPATTTKTNG